MSARSFVARPHLTQMTVGAVLGLGAPLGYMLLRRIGRKRRKATDRLAYAYMSVGTPIVFALFGLALGRREERLARTHAEMQRLREEFAAVVAHDLRSPINALRLRIDGLLARKDGPEIVVGRQKLLGMQSVTDRLSHMVDDLLDAANIDAARLSLRRERMSPRESVNALVDRIRPTLEPHPIDVRGLGPCVLADPIRFDQILTNLLENAAKYSPPDSPIVVVVERADGGAAISVTDQGMGIPDEEQARLFDRYYQTERARVLRRGLGLGLHIARGLVEAHGGRITVDSAPERGSTFRVWFPPGNDRRSGSSIRAVQPSSAQLVRGSWR